MVSKVALNAIPLILQSSAQLSQIVNRPINLARRLEGNPIYQRGCLCGLYRLSDQMRRFVAAANLEYLRQLTYYCVSDPAVFDYS